MIVSLSPKRCRPRSKAKPKTNQLERISCRRKPKTNRFARQPTTCLGNTSRTRAVDFRARKYFWFQLSLVLRVSTACVVLHCVRVEIFEEQSYSAPANTARTTLGSYVSCVLRQRYDMHRPKNIGRTQRTFLIAHSNFHLLQGSTVSFTWPWPVPPGCPTYVAGKTRCRSNGTTNVIYAHFVVYKSHEANETAPFQETPIKNDD